MVIYDLICDSLHEFEGWFKNSDDLESQQQAEILRCPVCESLAITKKVSVPKIVQKSYSKPSDRAQAQNTTGQIANLNAHSAEAYTKVQSMLSKVHKFIESNFEDVGNKFADQALSMHRGETETTNIRGTATSDQLKGLAEEGVAALPLPTKPVDKNKLN